MPNQPFLYVLGGADIEKPADVVTLQFDLVARHADQAKANQEVQAKATKILEMVDERKVAGRDVVAQSVRSAPQYEEDENGRRGKIIGFSVTRSFEVKLRDLSVFAKLIDDLLAIGGVEFSGVDGGLSNEMEVNDEMSGKALTDARESAEKTLKTLGMKIDGVFAVSPVSIPEIRNRMTNRDERVVVTGSYIPTPEAVDAKHYRLAPITVNQRVHVIYLISPVK